MGFDSRRFALAMVLSLVILFAFQWLFPAPHKPIPVQHQASAPDRPQGPGPQGAIGTPLGIGAERATPAAERAETLKANPRVAIDAPLVSGSISLKGGRLDDITLVNFHETIDPKSPAIVLLSPTGAPHAYVGEAGWVAQDKAVKLPDGDTVWTADSETLTVGKPVTLTWSNGAGLTFTRSFTLDDHYMFTIHDGVKNDGTGAVTLRPYALLSRSGSPPQSSTWISYEGPMGTFNGVEEDVTYKEMAASGSIERPSTGGWLGFGDKYWLGAVAPANQAEAITATFRHAGEINTDTQKFQVDYLGSDLVAAPGATVDHATLMFAGPKEVKLLATYTSNLNLPRFDNAVDWGWFWFFTKPIFYVLDWIYSAVGNFGIAILLLTVCMRALFFPLQTRAVLSMNKMKVLQPAMAKLREQYADDKPKMNQEIADLYKRSGANPVAGCLPILLQIPVFFSLYKVLFVSIEMRHAPFFGWIRDLSAPDPTNVFTLFGLIPIDLPQALHVGVWPMIYCAAMYTQQRLGPQAPDPTQAKMMQFMPFLFTFMLGNFPVGLVIYWSWSTILVIGQQYLINNHIVGNRTEAKA